MGIDEAGRGPVLGFLQFLALDFLLNIHPLFLKLFNWDNFFHLHSIVVFFTGPMVYGCLYCALSFRETLSTLNFAGWVWFSFFLFSNFSSLIIYDSQIIFFGG